jgi:tRNA1(Val) A37 N6-methylase TrmN6
MMQDERFNGPHAFFGGLISVFETKSGHQSGTDAVLLAACLPTEASGLLFDLGCGSGVVGLAVAVRCHRLKVRLVDVDADMVALARHNSLHNGLGERVEALQGDVLAPFAVRQAQGLGADLADMILSNPPFHPAGRVQTSPVEPRARAHVLDGEGMRQWMKTLHTSLKPKGRFVMIHRPDMLPLLLEAMLGRFGAIHIRPVHGKAGRPATRILVSGVKGSRAPLTLLEPLVLHDAQGKRTPEEEAIARGRSLIDMGL